MEQVRGRMVVGGAVLGWLVVGAHGLLQIASEEASDDWEGPYLLFSIALFVGSGLTAVTAWTWSRRSERELLRRVGLGACALAVLSTVVAWALPLWMTTLAVSFALLAVASSQRARRGLAILAASQLVGMAVLFAALAAEVGPRDSYGDYPVAFGIGLVVTSAGSVIGLLHVLQHSNPDYRQVASPVCQEPPATARTGA